MICSDRGCEARCATLAQNEQVPKGTKNADPGLAARESRKEDVNDMFVSV
jgi:hypothetical protein